MNPVAGDICTTPAGSSSNNDRLQLLPHQHSLSSTSYPNQHDTSLLDMELPEGGHPQQPYCQRLVVLPERMEKGAGGGGGEGVGVFPCFIWGLPKVWVLAISLVALMIQVGVCAFAFSRGWASRNLTNGGAPHTVDGSSLGGRGLLLESGSAGPGGGVESCLALLQQNAGNLSSGVGGGELGLTFNDVGVLRCHHYPSFHFRPRGKWQNDPNGPMVYGGLYHLFFQYNPHAAVWGNIQWGHAVSSNLLDWLELPIALAPDQSYDEKGVYSGSATFLDDGSPVLLYTGVTGAGLQVQNMAGPANLSDPQLEKWVKSNLNPLMSAPPAVDPKNFRDPTTAWKAGNDSKWRILIGAADPSYSDGSVEMFVSADFLHWEFAKRLHAKPGTGMWECPDLLALPVNGGGSSQPRPLDGNTPRKHLLKISLDRYRVDCYVVGTYNESDHSWTPDNPSLDVGPEALRYDYGQFYASKAFFDSKHNRTVLWGWVPELSTESVNQAKGWASLQALPRVLHLDHHFNDTRLIQMPVPEIETRRGANHSLVNVTLPPRSLFPVEGLSGSELDMEIAFERPSLSSLGLNMSSGSNPMMGNATEYPVQCCQGPHMGMGKIMIGLFGLLVLTDSELVEQTSVYFELSYYGGMWGKQGELPVCLCHDLSRSSLYSAAGVRKPVYNTTIPLLSTENTLTLRVLVDRSIVEVFAQGGRSVITSRVYPKLALGNNSHVFLFNNGTAPVVLNSFTAWQMVPATLS